METCWKAGLALSPVKASQVLDDGLHVLIGLTDLLLVMQPLLLQPDAPQVLASIDERPEWRSQTRLENIWGGCKLTGCLLCCRSRAASVSVEDPGSTPPLPTRYPMLPAILKVL